ncbi:MAG: S9 family peptidase [Phyllobacteriaceae bacterium]|nr:S9 family peptidase [Phyllobacteriaceae bacterium]
MTDLVAPVAERRAVVETWHGLKKTDDYKWMKADNWQEVMQDPALLPLDIRAYLEAENAFTKAKMADTEGLQDALFAELKGRIKEDDQSVPTPDGPYIYASAFVVGGQYPLLKRTPKSGGTEQVMFDCNEMAKGKAYFSLGGVTRSPDHSLAAWSQDDKGSEFYEMRIRNLATGQDMADVLSNTSGEACWSADGQHVFYTVQDDNHRPLKSYRHKLGTAQGEDVLVYEEKDIGMFSGIGSTQSDRFIIINAHDHDTSECWLIDADKPLVAPRLVAARIPGIEYELEHQGDNFIIKTNINGAEDYKLVTAPVSDPSPAKWVDLVPHRPGVFLVGYAVFKEWLVRLERENALPRIVVRHMPTGEEHTIAFSEEAYSLGLGDMREYDTDILRFTYSSPTTPAQVFDYNMWTRKRTLRKTQEVPSGHDPSQYVARRLLAPAHDGEQIPVTLLYHKDTPLDGTAPLWLYGYGSYGISMPSGFNTNILSLVNRGFIYAVAHIRGGQEKGRFWYKTGKLEKKVNTFKDFISCGEHLVKQGLTRRGQIVAQGGSAGGLLMGAVANMAPDLFKGIVAEVPFVDALTTMLDDTLPLTPPEWPEWGNPIADKQAYETIASYAPYENVVAQAYPHIFALGGLTDPRVTYWEPAKWVAKLRTRNTSGNLLLLKINMGAGHGGASGRFDRLKEVAEVYAFGLKVTGKINAA